MANEKMMSGAEFKAHFTALVNTLEDTDLVYFGNADLSLLQVKERGTVNGSRMVQIVFNEVYTVSTT